VRQRETLRGRIARERCAPWAFAKHGGSAMVSDKRHHPRQPRRNSAVRRKRRGRQVAASSPHQPPPVNVPVTCDDCGAVFASGIAMGPGSRIEMTRSSFGCPVCGGRAVVNAHWEVTELRKLVVTGIDEGQSAEDLADAIELAMPRFAAFAQWIRDHPWFASAVMAPVLSAVISALVTHWLASPGEAPSQPDITTIVQQFITVPSPQSPAPPAAARGLVETPVLSESSAPPPR